ncbi:hypothetical protein [Lampropedia puyangensis]|nr:hypothetical protein [Lampropedia puyangensis]
MGSLDGVRDWETFKSFVFGGVAGPLGRPVSLASFLLDDFTWPSEPYSFKRTNLLIHLLTGLMLCWATLNLLRLYGISEDKAIWIALLNMGLWLLHPYMVSTTLYVVQRMAQLAALFMFAGLAAYLHGRRLLASKPLLSYLWMSGALGLGTLLAAFSKENGVLLPLLVLIVEFCLPTALRFNKPDWRWRALFLWFPTGAIAYKVYKEINFSADLWPTRAFNQVERLWSETRILWEYLYHLYVPRIEGRGLFQDGFLISTGWLEPITTIFAALGLLALLLIAFSVRHRWPFITLAILFFFGAHVLESSVFGLELYFEHRNYVAAAFLFLPIAAASTWLIRKISPPLVATIYIALLGMLAVLTWQRATLWSDNDRLQTYWAVTSPESPRAQNFLAVQLFKNGQPDQGMAFLQEAMIRLPNSSLLTMQWLLQRVLYGVANEQDFQLAKQRIAHQRFDAQAVLGMRMIVEELITTGKPIQYRQWSRELLHAMEGNRQYQAVPLFRRLKPYLEGLLWLADGQVEKALPLMVLAMDRYADTDTALSIVAHFGNAGYPAEALQLLDKAQSIYEKQPVRKLKRSSEVYDLEFPRLRALLLEDLRKLSSHRNETGLPEKTAEP